MKTWKTLIAAVLIAASLALPITAKDIADEAILQPISSSEDGMMPYAEVTKWYYRMHNEKLQRRLWSVTYGKWLTEWEDCEP